MVTTGTELAANRLMYDECIQDQEMHPGSRAAVGNIMA
jgi:hypothetical protein